MINKQVNKLEKTKMKHTIVGMQYGNTGCGVFKRGVQN